MSAQGPSIPLHYCAMGRHFYPAAFVNCPTHHEKLFNWNVRIRTKFHTISKPDGSKTNDWTFQQRAETAKRAAQIVVKALFEGREAAEYHMRKDPEVWLATQSGEVQSEIDPRRQWKGSAR